MEGQLGSAFLADANRSEFQKLETFNITIPVRNRKIILITLQVVYDRPRSYFFLRLLLTITTDQRPIRLRSARPTLRLQSDLISKNWKQTIRVYKTYKCPALRLQSDLISKQTKRMYNIWKCIFGDALPSGFYMICFKTWERNTKISMT